MLQMVTYVRRCIRPFASHCDRMSTVCRERKQNRELWLPLLQLTVSIRAPLLLRPCPNNFSRSPLIETTAARTPQEQSASESFCRHCPIFMLLSIKQFASGSVLLIRSPSEKTVSAAMERLAQRAIGNPVQLCDSGVESSRASVSEHPLIHGHSLVGRNSVRPVDAIRITIRSICDILSYYASMRQIVLN
jgi:hypothetical protein